MRILAPGSVHARPITHAPIVTGRNIRHNLISFNNLFLEISKIRRKKHRFSCRKKMNIRKIDWEEGFLGPLDPPGPICIKDTKMDVWPKYFYTAPNSLAMIIRKKTLS